MYEFDLICLGCGPAGEKAALQASIFGRRVAIVERRARPGGAMVNTGTIPSKALRETALLCSAFTRRPLPGTDFRIDRSVSVAKFMAQRHFIEQTEHDRIERSIDRHCIAVFRGHGRLIDPHTVEVRGADNTLTTLRSRFILIATGPSPFRPSHVPVDCPNVVDADGNLDLERIPASLTVVAGGLLGCEYASIFAEMGVKVTLVHSQPNVLPFVDPECRQRLLQSLTVQNVAFEFSKTVSKIEPIHEQLVRVHFETGEAVTAETLLWAAGRSSNTQGIGLEAAGVEVDQGGLIRVNRHYQTSVPTIYAAGDVVGFPALAATSMEQGRIAAHHMFNIDVRSRLTELMPIGLYTIPAISMVGMNVEQAEQAGHEVVVGRALYRDNVRGRMLGDEQGLLKCVFDRHSRALLGATIVGEDATELIHIAQCIMNFHGGIDDFIDACFNYPSLSELYKSAAYDALQAMSERPLDAAQCPQQQRQQRRHDAA